VLVACWAGPLEEGEAQFRAFHDVAEVKAELVGPTPFPAINAAFDGLFPKGLRQYWKGNFVKELTDEAIAAHAEHGPKAPTVSSTMHLYPIDGAPHRIASDATAFGHRDANWSMVIVSGWEDPAEDDANIQWVRDYSDAIAPHSQAGGYVNFMSEDDDDRATLNYGANYERLVEIKGKYDPENVFHVNQNVSP
jgi:FAD/FMN-containing dehydrogenase